MPPHVQPHHRPEPALLTSDMTRSDLVSVLKQLRFKRDPSLESPQHPTST